MKKWKPPDDLEKREQGYMTTHSSRALTLLDNTSGRITYRNIRYYKLKWLSSKLMHEDVQV